MWLLLTSQVAISPPTGPIYSGGGLPAPGPWPSTPNLCHLMHEIPQDHSLLLQRVPYLPMWLRVKVQIQKIPGLQGPQGLAQSLPLLSPFFLFQPHCLPATHTSSSHSLRSWHLGISVLGTPCPQPFPGGHFLREAFRSVSPSSPISHCSWYRLK